MNQESDTYYIEQVIKGDVNAFANLVYRYQDQAYTLALRISGNSFDAEEIAQDAFMKVYKSLKNFKQQSKFSTWLYRIVYNTAITKQRSNKKHNQSVDLNETNLQVLTSAFDAYNKICKEERIAHLNNALENLPDDEKFIIHLYYSENKSVKEISEISEIGEDNVKIKLFRIRKKLMHMLSNTLKNEIFDIYG